ncbi:replicative DNA helicase [Streptomyces sp. 130]|uniref:replicative DNA helicase n=1 Tax=Streptomyces sp. 130 TaxID=2591006 RepID=UPI0011811F0E|nr:replicative DNA helicase [Streptomyces sp. 130]TRV71766.1 replicative DNA helicase [Streptomyces sp. 130]
MSPASDAIPRQQRDSAPPQDLDAEMSVLGAMLLDGKDTIGSVLDCAMQARDYYRPAHETIHAAILDLYARSEPADPITVAAELVKRGQLDKVGGAPYLHQLVQAVPTAANATYYAEIVHERAVLRRLVRAGGAIAQMGAAGEGDLDDIRSAAEAQLLDALKGPEQTSGYAPVSTDVPGFWDGLEARMRNGGATALTGLPTGLEDLDALTGGLQPSQLVVIGARPAVGKSTLALDIARHAAIVHGKTVGFFSLEMGRDEITQRLFSAEARVALHHIRSGTVTPEDLERLSDHTAAVQDAPLLVDDSADLSLMEIRSRARRIKQQRGLDLLVVDYLQLMGSGGSRKAESRQQEVSEMSRNLKLLAKELKIPVIALSQLNRGSEQRTEKRPVMSDLRESGSIEQDADLVLLLHREDVYDKFSPRAGEADLIVAKHRNGPTATITVGFQGHYSRFVDMGKG